MIYSLSIVVSILFSLYLLRLVKQNKLDEKYSIFWILFSLVIILFSLMPHLIEILAKWLTIYYAPSLLFFFGILFMIGYLIHLSIVITKQNKMIIRLTQEVGLLKETKVNVDQKKKP